MLVQMEVGFYVSGAWPLIVAERRPVRNVAMAQVVAGHLHPPPPRFFFFVSLQVRSFFGLPILLTPSLVDTVFFR